MGEEIEEIEEKSSGSDIKAIEKAKKDKRLVIEEEDFVLIPTRDDGQFFDVYLLKKIKPKGKPERIELKLEAYGATMQYSIRLISINRLILNITESSINLEEFLIRYENVAKELKEKYGIPTRK